MKTSAIAGTALLVVAACGGPALSYREAFTLSDLQQARGFEWVQDTAGVFRLYAEAGSGPAGRLDEVAAELNDEVLPRIREIIGRGIGDETVHVFLLEDAKAMKRLLGWGGAATAHDPWVLQQLPENSSRLGAHEFVHVATSRHFGEKDGFGALALDEGLAVFASGRWRGHDLHALTKHLRGTDRGLPLRTLLTDVRGRSELITYPQLGSFVAYLHERFGTEALVMLLERQYSSDEPVFEAVLGVGLEELEVAWLEAVDAADAGGITY